MYHHLIRTGEISPVVQPTMVLAEVHYTVPATTFLGIMDTVRNKVLDLALELEHVAPLAGQPDTPAEQQDPAAAVINNHFHAASNVAIGSAGTSQVVLGVPAAGDVDALLRYLGGAGLPPAQLHELAEVIAADQAEDVNEHGDPATRWGRTRALAEPRRDRHRHRRPRRRNRRGGERIPRRRLTEPGHPLDGRVCI